MQWTLLCWRLTDLIVRIPLTRLIKFKGRSSLKQYVPLKPVKCGIKTWVRADAKNGIMCELSVYTGKENDQPGTNLGAKVVKKLTRNIAGRNHHIYCDNYFTSVPLFEELLEEDSTYQKISRIPVSNIILPSIFVNCKVTLSLITHMHALAHSCLCLRMGFLICDVSHRIQGIPHRLLLIICNKNRSPY